jgi:hypothetical protein
MKGYDCIDGTCQCRYCHVTQPCTDFILNGATPRGHTLQCRNCHTAARHIKLGSKPQKHLPDRNCPWCGTTFHGDHARAKYCSEACHYAARSKPDASRVHFQYCKNCRQAFASPTGGRVYCSDDCRVTALKANAYTRNPNCPDCGDTRDFYQHYCPTCVLRRRREQQRAGRQQRRALIRNAPLTEPVNARLVYERDDWTCGICRRPVDPSVIYPDPGSPSLDHVIPLARNGSHTYLNTQLAHLACNQDKSDHLPKRRHIIPGQTHLF